MKKKYYIAALLGLCSLMTKAADQFVSFSGGDIHLNKSGTVRVYVGADEPRGVMAAAQNLCKDINKVCGARVTIVNSDKGADIVVRTVPDGKWEQYVMTVGDGKVSITGSDRRGTIYGIYEISKQIGVSPWYWWADAPIERHKDIYVKNGEYTDGEPAVKYRGIFINDESPSFTGWAHNRFGGVNSKMYAHIFELLLRLKANYLWPAMWSNAFNEDDEMSPVLADSLGIVMGTSHHEPMMRAHKEYTKRRKEIGPWDYVTNKKNIDDFFTLGLERNKRFDNVITIGMRGDGDSPMGKGDDDANIETLKGVIEGQRRIIGDVYGKNASEVPQLWAIFTEVQRYYDRGMTVPQDVIRLFCDNNWGYIRRTGPKKEGNNPMGLYYHIDMNGGPWNNRWINCDPVAKLREQLNLAYRTGLDDLWIINVGDLKPKELSIDFIMKFAWNPESVGPDGVEDYLVDWARSIFGEKYAVAIADIVAKYTKYNGMRHPENQSTRIFSVMNHHEADRMIEKWDALERKADSIKALLPKEAQDAYYQLVYYPAVASAGVAKIYLYADKNHTYAAQGRPSANKWAAMVDEMYKRDKRLESFYNDDMANGKWKGMMQDRHFGYTHWWMPKQDSIPVTCEVAPLPTASMGVVVEGSEKAAVSAAGKAESNGIANTLPVFDNMDSRTYYIDVFNKGRGQLECQLKASAPWIRIVDGSGAAIGQKAKLAVGDDEERLNVSIDWEKLGYGTHEGEIVLVSGKDKVALAVKAVRGQLPESGEPYFGNLTGREFSIPATAYVGSQRTAGAKWVKLTDLGREDGDMGIWPVTAASCEGKDAPRLDYSVYFDKAGEVEMLIGVLPTQDVNPERGLRIAVAVDEEEPQVLDARQGMQDTFREYTEQNLAKSHVLKAVPRANRKYKLISGNNFCRNGLYDAVRWLDTKVKVPSAGVHKLRVYMVDPEVVLERIIVNPDNEHPSYMGSPAICKSN